MQRNEKKTISNFSIVGHWEANLVACQGGTWNQGLWVEFVRVVPARKIFRALYSAYKPIAIVTCSPIYPLGVVCYRNLSQCVCETFLCALNVRYYILFFDISVIKESVAWRVRLRHWTCAGTERSFYIRHLLSWFSVNWFHSHWTGLVLREFSWRCYCLQSQVKSYEAVLARLKFYKAFYLALVSLEKSEVRPQACPTHIQLYFCLLCFFFSSFFFKKNKFQVSLFSHNKKVSLKSFYVLAITLVVLYWSKVTGSFPQVSFR